MGFSLWHLLIVLAVVLVVFGAGRLPNVMGDLGKGVRNFKAGLDGKDDKTEPPKPLTDQTKSGRRQARLMFDIAWSELFVIGAVALVAIGPKDLPKTMLMLGRAARQLKLMSQQMRQQLDQLSYEAEIAAKAEAERKPAPPAAKPPPPTPTSPPMEAKTDG